MRATEVLLQTLTEAVLLESRLDFLREKSRDALTARYQQDGDVPDNVARQIEAKPGETAGDKLFAFLVDLDPDRAKKNLQWLIRIYLKGNFPLEDYYKAPEYLSQFATLKPQLAPDKRDINRYPGLADLYTAIAGLVPQPSNRELNRETDRKMHQQAKVLLNTAEYKIVVPLTQEASCYFGVNTRWCTASTGSYNYFDDYNKRGPLYIILDKANNQRWQFQIESKSFMDENDRGIDLRAFIQNHPAVAEFFAEMDRQASPQATTFRGMPVVLTDTTILFKTEYGLLGRILGRIPVENNKVVGHVQTRDLDLHRPDAHEEFSQLLTGLGVQGNNSHLASEDIFWNHDRYGRLTEVGDPVMRFHNGLEWIGISFADWHYYDLTDADRAVWTELGIDHQGDTWISTTSFQPNQTYPMITDLLIRHPAAKKVVKSSNPVDPSMIKVTVDMLPDDLLRRLIDAKPEMGSISILHRLHGVTDVLKQKIVEALDEEEATHEGWEQDRLIVARYDSLDDLIETVGGSNAKWVHKLLAGEVDFHDFENVADSYDRKRLINHLDPETLTRLGTYLQENYPDEVEDEFDGDFDPGDVDQVIALADTVNDDDLQNACDRAVQEASRVGAENDAYEALVKTIENNPYIVATRYDNAGQKGFTWDSPAAITVPVADVVDLIEKGSIPTGHADDWLDNLGEKLELHEPRYGWSGHDDDAEKEYFIENVHEFI